MSDAQRTIDLIFNGVDKTGSAVQSVIGNTSKLAGNIQSATQPIADFTFAALKFEAALLSAGLAVTAFAVKTAGDFDGAFREISTLLNQPIEDLGEFRQAILDYAGSSTAPLEQVTGAIYNAISAGVDFADSIDVVAQAEKLSVAGKADLNDSLLVLVSSLNAYGLGMDQAERFSDLLFQTVRSGQTTLPELSGSLAQVTGIAATTGVSFDELLAAVATLTATGTPTTQAVTQIRGALAAILKPTSDAASAADELGINFSLQRLEAVGLSGVLDDVQKATGGNAEQMARLFGRVDALNGVLTLTGLGADKFAETLVAMDESAGATGVAYGNMAESIGLSTQKVQNALTGLLISIGDPLLDEFGGVAESIAAMFQALGGSVQSDNGLGPLLQYVEQVAQEIEQAFAQVAKNLPDALAGVDTGKAIAGLESLRDAFSGLFKGVDLSTPEGLRDAIQRAVDAFGNLSEFSAGAIEGLGPLVKIAASLFNSFAEMDSATARANGEVFGFTTTINILSGVVADLLPSLETLLTIFILGKGGSSLVGAFKAGAVALGGSTGLVALLGSGGLVTAAGAAGAAVGTLANKVTELGTGTSLSTRLTDFLISIGAIDDEATNLANSLNDIPFTKTGGSVAELDAEMLRLGGNTEASASKFYNFATGLWEVEDSASASAWALEDASNILHAYPDSMAGAVTALDTVDKGLQRAADSTGELSKAAESITLEEKLALIAGQAQIASAQIEADAVRISAAFESIGVTVSSTGELIGELFGQINDAPTLREVGKIESQIEKENKRRQDALDLQSQLTRAELRLLNERANALRSGGALITVNGDGLEPHLEAIMFEVLKAVQVRVNQEGLGLLLGVE